MHKLNNNVDWFSFFHVRQGRLIIPLFVSQVVSVVN